MEIESDLRHGRHCVFKMHVHLVFVTKYRRNVFTKEVLDDLKIFFEKVCLDFESELVEFDGADYQFGFVGVYPKIGSGIANPLFASEVNPQPDPCLPSLFIHQQLS